MKAALLIASLLGGSGLALADAPKPPKPTKAPAKPARVKDEVELRPTAGKPIKKIAIENPLGDVRVEGYNGDSILIESQKSAPDDESLDRMRISLVPNPDGTVRIKTTVDPSKEAGKVARGQVRVDLLVRAPRDARVEAVSTSGTLEVLNMDGGGDLDTASGNIIVTNVQGALSTSSVSGATTLTQVYGSIDAETVSSDLDLDSITGERLVANASSGRIAGRRVRSRHIELTTTDGRITLEAELALNGKLIVASMRGNVDVRVRRTGALIVRARGQKPVEFDKAAQQLAQVAPTARPDGFTEAQFGQLAGNAPSALVELRSQFGLVTFGMIR